MIYNRNKAPINRTNDINILTVSIFVCTLIPLFGFLLLYIRYEFRYVPITLNVSACSQSESYPSKANIGKILSLYASIILMLIFVQEYPASLMYVLLSTKLHIPKMHFKNRKIPYRIFQASVVLLSVAIFSLSTYQQENLFCVQIFQLCCNSIGGKKHRLSFYSYL